MSGRVLAAVQLPQPVVVRGQQGLGSGVQFQGTSAPSSDTQSAPGLWAAAFLPRGGAGQREPLAPPRSRLPGALRSQCVPGAGPVGAGAGWGSRDSLPVSLFLSEPRVTLREIRTALIPWAAAEMTWERTKHTADVDTR